MSVCVGQKGVRTNVFYLNLINYCNRLKKRARALPFKDNADYLVSGAIDHPSRRQ